LKINFCVNAILSGKIKIEVIDPTTNLIDKGFVSKVKDDLEGHYTVGFYSDCNKNEKVNQIEKRYKEKYGKESNGYVMMGYDAVNYIHSALTDYNSEEEKMIDALKQVEVKGLNGDYIILKNGETTMKPYLLKIEKGLINCAN